MTGGKFLTIGYEIWGKGGNDNCYSNPQKHQICIEVEDLKDLVRLCCQIKDEMEQKDGQGSSI